MQETYLQAFRRLETYRGEAPLEVWLRAIALGRSSDWKRVMLRRLKRTARLTESSGWWNRISSTCGSTPNTPLSIGR